MSLCVCVSLSLSLCLYVCSIAIDKANNTYSGRFPFNAELSPKKVLTGTAEIVGSGEACRFRKRGGDRVYSLPNAALSSPERSLMGQS